MSVTKSKNFASRDKSFMSSAGYFQLRVRIGRVKFVDEAVLQSKELNK